MRGTLSNMRFIGAGTEKMFRGAGALAELGCASPAESSSGMTGPCPSRPLGGMDGEVQLLLAVKGQLYYVYIERAGQKCRANASSRSQGVHGRYTALGADGYSAQAGRRIPTCALSRSPSSRFLRRTLSIFNLVEISLVINP